MKAIFFDTETTGKDAKDRICQFAFAEYGVGESIEPIGEVSYLFKPSVPIGIEAMSVHHITNEMVANEPPFVGSEIHGTLKDLMEDDENYCIAHNAKFDVAMLEREDIVPKNVICTLKIARHLDPEGKLPKHNLQYLRYALGLQVTAVAHDALGDVRVLKALFDRLYAKVAEGYTIPFPMPVDYLKEMVRLSSQPVTIVRFNFGKHVGKKIADVAKEDADYLRWLYRSESQKPDADEDMLYTLKKYI